jgi:predicted AAA+ superfamily ATPase
MSISNRERIGQALEILNAGLRPFVEREMEASHGHRWRYQALNALRDYHITSDGQDLHLDTQALFLIMWDQWKPVFSKTLGHMERNYISELRETRNRWAHQEAFNVEDVSRALDSIHRLLRAVSADEAKEINRQLQEVMRLRFEEQTRKEVRNSSEISVAGQPTNGLLPWRNVITPHPDVSSGRYQLAEFAADLGQVYRNEGSDEYRRPQDFFQRTFLTEGLKRLLTTALCRLSGTGGDPVIELQTNFGGGKTHSLLALYHLFSGTNINELVGIEPVLAAANVTTIPKVQRAVLVGFEMSPGEKYRKPDGTIVHTLWGELAWQLLGSEGYAMVADTDRQGISPGSATLRELLSKAAPCLVLIDEWVAYIRHVYSCNNLPGGSFDTNISFAQALTESVKAVPRALLVGSLPSSAVEAGGQGGAEALDRLRTVFGRLESPWSPAGRDESFEIVRRRLFQPITEPNAFTARDAVAKAFADYYRTQPQEFPSFCREADYEQRIKTAYPIHPELFDRLYNDWSSLEKFQRTRGVLRLMAKVVHSLWERQDASLLILPATVPVDDSEVQAALMQYLPDTWRSVIEKDIDGSQALPILLDRNNTNLGRFSACRRVARTIFFGSAPTEGSQNKGVSDSQIKLGCTQPGESVATFGDALRRLTDEATYLYLNDRRYWYTTQPSVTRIAQDRAAQYDEEDVLALLIKDYLRAEQRGNKGDFLGVHPCPDSPADIPDEEIAIRLILVKPHYTHSRNDPASPARQEAAKLLEWRGTAPRNNRNTLIFLAADRLRMDELKQMTRQYMAWKSIEDEREPLNLDPFQFHQAKTKREDAHTRILALIPEAYSWLLVPEQQDPKVKSNQLAEYRLPPQQGQGLLASNASRYLRSQELLVTQLAGVMLRNELDKIPLWRGNRVHIKELVENFAKYVYLPRLKHQDVLLNAIRDGIQSTKWAKETFAYASGWDEAHQRYLNLQAGHEVNLIVDAHALLVKPETALAQMEADALEAEAKLKASSPSMAYMPSQERGSSAVLERHGATTTSLQREGSAVPVPVQLFPLPEEAQMHRFYGSVTINERLMGRDAAQIMDEVVKHLVSLNDAKVKVTLEIQAEVSNGVPTDVVRTVKENCKTLHFETFGFEEN